MAKRRVHLTFPGTLADEPIMWQLCRDFGLVFNIRQADMMESVGWMMLQLEGSEDAIDQGIRWLEDKGIKVAPIEQDVFQ
ncbi:MAG: NIL domain-containing protein [Anaerolineales bacterium]